MKKAIVIILFAVFAVTSESHAQAIIIRPPFPAAIRPVCPGPGYVWYGPYRHWNRRVNAYVSANGYWARPRGWHAGWRYRY